MYLKQLLSFLLLLLFMKNLYKSVNQIFSFEFDEQYLEFINDSIARENFSYYSFHNEGRFKLKLISTYGDADIYISSDKKPGYGPNEYDISSTTCGVDIIELNEDIKRPAYIGIYGAGHTDWSNYTLLILIDNSGGKDLHDFNIKHKLNFIIRYTTMWRFFEILESILL
ncbi:UPF0669 protein v1g209471-like [Atheta coriaria]|uniref:UPF0669 protein v1g209471-like n=1 Tax=Dalotia coriaria TaxID=877792 RepID=UPI0031F3802F